jgi:glutamate racemase
VLSHLVDRFPGESFIYAADSSHFPYGEKSLEEVRGWFLEFAAFFHQEGSRAIVVACNTATAAALDAAREQFPLVPIVGVVEAAAQHAARATRNGRIGVLSTHATYLSGLYPQTFAALNPAIAVVSKPCPVLVQMAENGDVKGRHVEDEVRQCLAPVLGQGVDTIILGCTHFPHMRQIFNRAVPENVLIVVPGEVIADYLPPEVQPRQAGVAAAPVLAWTTGSPAKFAAISAKLCPTIPLVTSALYWQNGHLTPR